MKKIMKNNARGLAIAMSAVMALSVSVVPAEAKKAKISTTKVTVTVGKAKKVTVKNASKVTWKITSGKANIKLSKKSKKGATIKGKKKGTAKIAVTMKSGKKNIKKTIKVTVKAKKTTDTTKKNATSTPAVTPTPSPVATPTATPTATPEVTPTATPEPTTPPAEGYSRVVLDLSQAVDATKSGGVTYNAQNKVLQLRDVSLCYFTLPEMIPSESNLTVTVKGVMNASNTGDEARGFRCYTITDGEDVAMSEIGNSEEDAIDTVGEFTWTFDILTNADCNCIQLKGIQHGISIAELDISQIIVDYKKPAE